MLDLPRNCEPRQSDVNIKYSGTHLLLSGETNLKNYNEWITKKFLHIARVKADARVMDFGAGIGTLAKIFFEFTGIKPDCVEVDPEQRAVINQRGFNSYSNLDVTILDYDLIYTSNVLEHIEEDEAVLNKLKSNLKDNGVIIIFVPAFEVIWTAMDDRVGHRRRYTKKTLLEKLVQSGYEVKSMYYCDSVGFLLSFLFKFLGSKSGEPSLTSLKIYDNYLLPISKLIDILSFGVLGKNLIAVAQSRRVNKTNYDS
jgi:SAM-dependent methyltransferase